jgi:Uri superfamily endonuclease
VKGIYALEILLDKDACIKIGALGEVLFKKGVYVYAGSAQNNLEKRVQRHLRKENKLFWHIDYLLNHEHSKIIRVLLRQGNKEQECAVAKELGMRGEAVEGFGCSDCHCRSHLFWFPTDFEGKEPQAFFTKHE